MHNIKCKQGNCRSLANKFCNCNENAIYCEYHFSMHLRSQGLHQECPLENYLDLLKLIINEKIRECTCAKQSLIEKSKIYINSIQLELKNFIQIISESEKKLYNLLEISKFNTNLDQKIQEIEVWPIETIERIFASNLYSEIRSFQKFKFSVSNQGILNNFPETSNSEMLIYNGMIQIRDEGSYLGQLTKNNVRIGHGEMYYNNDDYYNGEWHNGLKHGHGCYKWKDGKCYTGQFVADKKHGSGKLVYPSGDYYEGQWANDQKNGFGKFVWENGDFYEGSYVDGIQHGKGIINKNGQVTSGNWYNGMRC